VRLLTNAIAGTPQPVEAYYLLVDAHLASGDPVAAGGAAERGLKAYPQDAHLHALRGDALLATGERLAAELAYRRSVQIRPDPDVSRKLAELTPPAPAALPSIGAQLRIRYDGSVNEPLGAQILAALGNAFSEYERRLGTAPTQPVTVVLQTGTEFQGDTLNPEWAAGINDGTIRAPVGGLDRVTPGLLKVLRHELAHSFVNVATSGNCPTWLHEGIAQWLEGADLARDDALVTTALREQRLVGLPALAGGFRQLSTADATLAYAESHSAVAHILHTRGEPGLKRLLAALGDGLPAEEAFVVALAESYTEFHQSWTARLLANAPR
jgi:tetratricopeptide (TPR) repeat protein